GRRPRLPPRNPRAVGRDPGGPVPALDSRRRRALLARVLSARSRAPGAGRPLLPVATAAPAACRGPRGDRRNLHERLPARAALGRIPPLARTAGPARRLPAPHPRPRPAHPRAPPRPPLP